MIEALACTAVFRQRDKFDVTHTLPYNICNIIGRCVINYQNIKRATLLNKSLFFERLKEHFEITASIKHRNNRSDLRSLHFLFIHSDTETHVLSKWETPVATANTRARVLQEASKG